MSYEVIIRKVWETVEQKHTFYSEDDLIDLLEWIRNGFAVFEGLIIGSYKDLSRLQIIERNWDGLDSEWRPAQFFPFTGDSLDDFRNHAWIMQAYDDEHGSLPEDPMEFDVSAEYIKKYILSDGKDILVDSCKYEKKVAILWINQTPIKFKKYSDNACILEHLAWNKKEAHCSFYDITERKVWNDTLWSDKSFYSARRHINKRIFEKLLIREFIWVDNQALYSQYLGK